MGTFTTKAPDILVNMVKSDEGFRNRLYLDSLGLQTIGIGFCLDRSPLPEIVADFWCGHLLDQLTERIENNEELGRIYQNLTEPRKFALLNMAYQLGLTGLGEFRNMWNALEYDHYHEAAEHALDSRWFTQTPKRAKRIAKVIETGTLKPYGM